MKSLSLESRIPVEILKEVFEYKSGALYWKVRPLCHFKSQRAMRVFNSRYSGTVAGTPLGPKNQYLISQISYKGKKHSLLLHIATWAVVHGRYPDKEIDHLDGNGMNNQISNLYESGTLLNMRNKRKYRNNSSGICGVSWYQRYGKWVAQGSINGTKFNLGYFNSLFDAACARKTWELIYNFTQRHGR